MRRVVVTGLGMVTPLACGVEETWSRILDSQSAADTIKKFDASHLATNYACEIPRGDGSDGTFNPDQWMEPKDQRKVDDFNLLNFILFIFFELQRYTNDNLNQNNHHEHH